ncbi:KpsF/GutQ family sugar-phosphate isomerase [Thalassotalea mangrovi]|uniref:Arabinose 5-phosphate isomerase n=1 Tax=Thalassotalea mangrovi TaxID=2572245 RepID=A0A4U1B6N1_9GAMM|nr:KpsF/GutQ family sugar-phosphate isomerase [Thalassotalea mangrovi]TKB46110.1 KpsF/GutQ family sugar-phosphate isomerase [Thalassotalea mangrovi]
MEEFEIKLPELDRSAEDALILAQQTMIEQARQVQRMANGLGQSFIDVLNLLFNCSGRVVVSGMGKSGIIGQKIAATLASTGTPSFFIHPGEAFHGDLGMLRAKDVVVLITNSGETDEVLKLVPSLQAFGNKIVGITGNPESTLARNCDIALEIQIEKEVCPNELAPTTSTTATLVLGDALAIGLMHMRDFQPQDFAKFHPGGSLGRRLLTRVKDVMHKDNLPFIPKNDPMQHAIMVMTKSQHGIAIVVDGDKLLGVITDGDLRRALVSGENLNTVVAQDIMSTDPITINEDAKVIEAENLMRDSHIKQLLAVDGTGKVSGLLSFYQ